MMPEWLPTFNISYMYFIEWNINSKNRITNSNTCMGKQAGREITTGSNLVTLGVSSGNSV